MVEMQAGVAGLEYHGTREAFDGLLVQARPAEYHAYRVKCPRLSRPKLHGSVRRLQRFVRAMQPRKPAAQLGMRFCVSRIRSAGRANQLQPLDDATGFGRGDAANQQFARGCSQRALRGRIDT
jgi:hypothetical protein